MIYKQTKQGHFAYPKKDKLFNSILSPFWITRRELDKNIKELSKGLTGRVLDIGAGSQPYRKYFKDYSSLEIHGKDADYTYKDKFPFFDNVFDSAICTQVLEHVFDPEEFLREIKRCVKGKVLFTVPFMWDEHEQPYDYARYSSYGLKHLLNKAGFRIIEERKTVQDFSIMFQIFLMILYKKHKRPTFIIALPVNLLSQLFKWIKIKDFYLDNIVVVE